MLNGLESLDIRYQFRRQYEIRDKTEKEPGEEERIERSHGKHVQWIIISRYKRSSFLAWQCYITEGCQSHTHSTFSLKKLLASFRTLGNLINNSSIKAV